MLVKVLLFLYNIFVVIEMKECFFDYFKEDKLDDEENKDTLNFDLTMCCLYKKFPVLKEEKTLNLVILTSFIDERKSVEYISQLTKIPMKKIDNILLSHLYLFSYKMPELIDDILERGNYTISQVTSFKFIATQEPFLNETEKELLYNKIVIMHQLEVKKLLKLEEKNKTKILK